MNTDTTTETKVCSGKWGCWERKPLSEFWAKGKNAKGETLLSAFCSECGRKRDKVRYVKRERVTGRYIIDGDKRKCSGQFGCGEVKPLTDFRQQWRSKQGQHSATCLDCESESNKRYREQLMIKLSDTDVNSEMKECTGCGNTLPIKDFRVKESKCKECINKRDREAYKRRVAAMNPDEIIECRTCKQMKPRKVFGLKLDCSTCRYAFYKKPVFANGQPLDCTVVDYVKSVAGNDCAYCSKELDDDDIHTDHIIPKSQGGANVVENIALCCSLCNLRKGKASVSDSDYLSLLFSVKGITYKPSKYIEKLSKMSDTELQQLGIIIDQSAQSDALVTTCGE